MIPFRRPGRGGPDDEEPGTFDLLGFTHYWAKSLRGRWVVKQKTAKDRLSRTLRRIRDWCRKNRHSPVATQHLALSRKLQGHYAYFGITSNYRALDQVWHHVKDVWKKALARRNSRGLSWETMHALMQRHPLPVPRIVHRCGT